MTCHGEIMCGLKLSNKKMAGNVHSPKNLNSPSVNQSPGLKNSKKL